MVLATRAKIVQALPGPQSMLLSAAMLQGVLTLSLIIALAIIRLKV